MVLMSPLIMPFYISKEEFLQKSDRKADVHKKFTIMGSESGGRSELASSKFSAYGGQALTERSCLSPAPPEGLQAICSPV